MKGTSSTLMSQRESTTIIVTDEDTATMDSETLTPGHRNGMDGKVKNLITLFSSNQTHSIKRRLRKRTEISDFDSMCDDEEADYALMHEEEKLMLKDEHVANRRLKGDHDVSETDCTTLQNKVANDETKSSFIPCFNHAIASIGGTKEYKQTMKGDNHGAGVWLGTRGRKLIGDPLPPPPTILLKVPEVANPIIGGTATCSLQAMELKGPSTTINTILSFKRGLPHIESVPNPILPSSFEPKVEVDLMNDSDVDRSNPTTDGSHASDQIIKQESSTTLHFSQPQLEETKTQCEEGRTQQIGRKYSVSFSITESRDVIPGDNTSWNSSSLPMTRKRIFSAEIDCAGNDFEIGMDVSSAPTVNLRDTVQGSHSQTLNKVKQETECVSRDRGLSFELFSFGLNEFDAAPLYTSFDESTIQVYGRPRGDSIIFDPISFNDDGIHEQNALKRARRSSISSDVDEVAIMNTPGFLEAPISDCVISNVISNHLVPTEAMRDNHDMNGNPKPRKFKGDSGVRARANRVSSESHHATPKRKERSYDSKEDRRKYKRSSYSPTSSFNPTNSALSIPLTLPSSVVLEDTIQMPQGSQAAAAAAMSFYPQLLPVSLNGAVSHTSFPMALLNKDGRIGIYLPEARKERIAKFHSKRQKRTWRKRIKYDCRKKLADSRPRVKGRFVKGMIDGE